MVVHRKGLRSVMISSTVTTSTVAIIKVPSTVSKTSSISVWSEPGPPTSTLSPSPPLTFARTSSTEASRAVSSLPVPRRGAPSGSCRPSSRRRQGGQQPVRVGDLRGLPLGRGPVGGGELALSLVDDDLGGSPPGSRCWIRAAWVESALSGRWSTVLSRFSSPSLPANGAASTPTTIQNSNTAQGTARCRVVADDVDRAVGGTGPLGRFPTSRCRGHQAFRWASADASDVGARWRLLPGVGEGALCSRRSRRGPVRLGVPSQGAGGRHRPGRRVSIAQPEPR